jgi:hypothetical protein
MKLGQPCLEHAVARTVVRIPVLVAKDTRVCHEPVESRLGKAADRLRSGERYPAAVQRKISDIPNISRHLTEPH